MPNPRHKQLDDGCYSCPNAGLRALGYVGTHTPMVLSLLQLYHDAMRPFLHFLRPCARRPTNAAAAPWHRLQCLRSWRGAIAVSARLVLDTGLCLHAAARRPHVCMHAESACTHGPLNHVAQHDACLQMPFCTAGHGHGGRATRLCTMHACMPLPVRSALRHGSDAPGADPCGANSSPLATLSSNAGDSADSPW